jgi:hypothetical protein
MQEQINSIESCVDRVETIVGRTERRMVERDAELYQQTGELITAMSTLTTAVRGLGDVVRERADVGTEKRNGTHAAAPRSPFSLRPAPTPPPMPALHPLITLDPNDDTGVRELKAEIAPMIKHFNGVVAVKESDNTRLKFAVGILTLITLAVSLWKIFGH